MNVSKFVLLIFLIPILAACSSNGRRNIGVPSSENKSAQSIVPSSTEKSENQKLTEHYTQYLKSEYDIVFDIPSDWKLLTVKVHPNGYAQFFSPKAQSNNSQSIVIHFFQDEKTTPKEFLAKAKQTIAQLNCKIEERHIKKIQPQSVTFSITSKQCPTIHDLMQIYKAFQMPDGLYTISYKAILETTPEQSIDDISAVIEHAEIVKK